MSIALQISGSHLAAWSLSTADLGDVERLRSGTASESVEVLFGGDRTDAGESRTIAREPLVSAVDALLPTARGLPRGFQLRVPRMNGLEMNLEAPGVGGALIKGCSITSDATTTIGESSLRTTSATAKPRPGFTSPGRL